MVGLGDGPPVVPPFDLAPFLHHISRRLHAHGQHALPQQLRIRGDFDLAPIGCEHPADGFVELVLLHLHPHGPQVVGAAEALQGQQAGLVHGRDDLLGGVLEHQATTPQGGGGDEGQRPRQSLVVALGDVIDGHDQIESVVGHADAREVDVGGGDGGPAGVLRDGLAGPLREIDLLVPGDGIENMPVHHGPDQPLPEQVGRDGRRVGHAVHLGIVLLDLDVRSAVAAPEKKIHVEVADIIAQFDRASGLSEGREQDLAFLPV